MTRKRQPRGLSEDDLAAWRQVARTARPIHPPKTNQTTEASVVSEPVSTKPKVRQRLPEFRIGEATRYDHSKGHNLAPTLEKRLMAQHVQMDRKTFGRMKKGKIRPERKIDLHGMTLAQAHSALTRFVHRAHSERCRLILVVTGKGKPGADDGPIPRPRGVLRTQVPTWLSLPPLSSMVLQYTDAHISHGGNGAYYVYLRRSAR